MKIMPINTSLAKYFIRGHMVYPNHTVRCPKLLNGFPILVPDLNIGSCIYCKTSLLQANWNDI